MNSAMNGLGVPGITKKLSDAAKFDNYTVKWKQFDLSNAEHILDLSVIETEGMKGENIVLISSDKFTFMDRYFVVIRYMEKNV